MTKQTITNKLNKSGAAWAVTSTKYICTNGQCCQVLDGDKPAYHVHPDASHPHVDSIERFTSLRKIAEWINEG